MNPLSFLSAAMPQAPLSRALLFTLVLGGQSLSAQTTRTWIGADGNPGTNTNWSPNGPIANGDPILFNGSSAIGTLTATAAFQGAGNGVGLITVDGGQAAPLTFLSSMGAGSVAYRLLGTAGNSGLVINAGAGAVTFGGAGNAFLLNMGGAAGTSTFMNNSANTATFSSNVTINRGGATNQVAAFSGTGDWVVAGPVTNSISITKAGTGTLTLGGTNNHTLGTTLTGGTLRVTNTAGFGGAVGTVTLNGGTLELRNNGAGSNSNIAHGANPLLTNTGNTATIDVNNNGANTGNTISLAGAYGIGNSTLNVTGGNGYRLSLAAFNPTGGTVGTAVLNPTTANLTIGTVTNVNTSHTLQLGGTSADNLITGVMSDGAGVLTLNKTGTSTWTLSGANTYTGTTSINGGTLRLQNTGGAGTNVIQIGNGTLSLFRSAATTTFGNAITSVAATSGTLTVDGSGANAGVNTNSTYGSGTITVNGTLTISRPTGGTGHTAFSGALAGSGTLVIENTNGGVAPSTTALGRAQFTSAASTFNGSLQIQNTGNFMDSGSVAPSYSSVDIAAGGFLSMIGDRTTTIGTLTGGGSITKNVSANIATLSVGSGTFSGIIAQNLLNGTGTVALTKTGPGTLLLTGANTYTGTTTISGGTLQIGNGSSTGSIGTGAITNNGTLTVNRDNAITLANVIDGTGNFIQDGTGATTLSGANTFAGTVTVNSGTLLAGGSQAFGANDNDIFVSSGAALNTNGTLTAARDYDITISGTGIGGTGAIVNTGASHNNGFKSVTLAANATIGGSGRWDIRPITAGAAQLDLAGFTLTKTGANMVGVIDGSITSGTVNVTQGIFGLTRNTWATGTVNVSGGATLRFENNNGSSVYGMNMTLNASTLNTIGNNVTTSGTLGLTGTNTIDIATGITHTQSGVVSGTGGYNKNGGGILVLNGANTLTGTSNLTAGQVAVGHNQAFGTGTLDLRGATILSTDGTLRTIANAVSLSFDTTFGSAITGDLLFTGNVNKGGASKAMNVLNNSTTFSGVISGSGTGVITKTGVGTLIFTGANTYPGNTIVNGGKLLVNNSSGSGTGTGTVSVNNGGTLGGTGTIGGAATFNSGSVLSPGNSPGTITFNSGLTMNAGSTLNVEVLFGGTTSDLVVVNGAVALSGADLTGTWGGSSDNLFRGNYATGPTGTMHWILDNDGSGDLITGTFANAVPAPGFSALFGGVTPHLVGLGGQPFALFYESQFGIASQAGLTGGNDLLLIAVPEPGRMAFALLALGLLAIRRRR